MDKCKLCITNEVFDTMVEAGFKEEDAFHLAVGNLLENVLEEAVEKAYEAGHTDGYKEATVDIAEIVSSYVDAVSDEA